MNEVLDWARLEQQLKQPSKPSPCSEGRERDRLEISKIAEELRRREPHWSPHEVRRYMSELLESVLIRERQEEEAKKR
jgi:hypothetical protein